MISDEVRPHHLDARRSLSGVNFGWFPVPVRSFLQAFDVVATH